MRLALVLEIAIVLSGVSPPAHAETKRVRIPVSSLPMTKEPPKIAHHDEVMLPDGVRHGSPLPKSWKVQASVVSDIEEYAHCTDGRRASVGTIGANGEAATDKIWETNGKVFLDHARIKVEDGKVHVVEAQRVPVVYVSEAMWAYRDDIGIRLLAARDGGMFSRAIFYGCSLDTMILSTPSSVVFGSDPEATTEVMNRVMNLNADGQTKQRPRRWQGVAFSVLASVSKATADAETMLNVVINQP